MARPLQCALFFAVPATTQKEDAPFPKNCPAEKPYEPIEGWVLTAKAPWPMGAIATGIKTILGPVEFLPNEHGICACVVLQPLEGLASSGG